MPNTRRSVISLHYLVPLAIAAAALPALPATLTVSNIEVTQAVQTPTNTIALLAGRGTAVRATITVSGTGLPVAGISGSLHAFVAGAAITPAGGIAPVNVPFTAVLAPLRNNENHTLNFELPAPSGLPASNAVTFRVDLTVPAGDTGVSLTTPNLTFVNRTAPLIFFTRINYTPSGLGLPNVATIQAETGDAFVRGILPVDDSTATLYQQGLFPTLGYAGDSNGDGILDALGADGNNLISLLASCRQLIVNSGVGASDRIFLYGWLNGNPIDGNGLGQVGGRNAFGNTEAVRYQRTFAHELTHNFGFDHNPAVTNIDQTGWDVGGRLAGNPAGNNTTGRVKPTTLRDIMDAGLVTNQAWIHATQGGACGSAGCSSYTQLLGSATLAPDAAGDFATDMLIIQGIFDPSGERLLQLKPVFRYPWRSQPTARVDQRFSYSVRINTAAGQTITLPFNPRVADDASKEGAKFGFFEVMAPVSGAVRSLTITDASGNRVYGGFENSGQTPRVEITAPAPGATLDRETKVTARLAAPAGNTVSYQGAYSPDGGQSFVPIAVDLREPAFSFDATAVPPSTGKGLIRIFVSDGLNTSFADVDRLTTPGRTINAIMNAASFRAGTVSPGGIVSVFGQSIGPATGVTLRLTPAGLVDTLLGDTRVLFDGQPGPMVYASSGQVNAVAPYGIAGKSSVEIAVEYLGERSNVLQAAVAPTVPGIFALNGSGSGTGAILNQDGTVNSQTNPAPKGSIIAIYATGEGVTDPAGVDGKPAVAPLPKPVAAVGVSIGGQTAEVQYAGGAPGFVAGVVQVNARVPDAAPSGASVPVRLSVGSRSSQANITVAIR